MKAWRISVIDGDWDEVAYGNTAGQAKVGSQYYQDCDTDYVDLRATREPNFDREGDDTTPPSDAELVAGGWWVYCRNCDAQVDLNTEERTVVDGRVVFCSAECEQRYMDRMKPFMLAAIGPF